MNDIETLAKRLQVLEKQVREIDARTISMVKYGPQEPRNLDNTEAINKLLEQLKTFKNPNSNQLDLFDN